jgi:hypothetical protein
MSIVANQLEQLQRDYPSASATPLVEGTTLITIPHVRLPSGWNQERSTIYFIVPIGYPMAQPDCFWADDVLRLANGTLPKNAGVQNPPFNSGTKLWFSWHVSHWSAARDSLRTYVQVILNRFSCLE